MRRWIGFFAAFAIAAMPIVALSKVVFPDVQPGRFFSFPADHGAHPDYRTEWWYVTGWLDTPDGKSMGFQVTFFRSRTPFDEPNPSAFAPKEIIFAHAALSDPEAGHILSDSRAARAGFGLAEAKAGDAHVVLDDWTFDRTPGGQFRTHVAGKEFGFDLTFAPTQPVLLEGDRGYSQKGPIPTEASYYYSLPHLDISGTVARGGRAIAVKGTAWLDREWSSTYLDPNAVGWDWTGINLDDGSAVMAFRIRDKTGAALWAGGTYRPGTGESVLLARDQIAFSTIRRWHSPHTGADYPVEQTLAIRLPSGERQFRLTPLFDDQELAGESLAGPVYWEGAVKTQGGRGYLELTGYAQPLKM